MTENLQLGLASLQQQDYTTAFAILAPIAAAGNAEAQRVMGNLYYLGLGVEPDIAEAVVLQVC